MPVIPRSSVFGQGCHETSHSLIPSFVVVWTTDADSGTGIQTVIIQLGAGSLLDFFQGCQISLSITVLKGKATASRYCTASQGHCFKVSFQQGRPEVMPERQALKATQSGYINLTTPSGLKRQPSMSVGVVRNGEPLSILSLHQW